MPNGIIKAAVGGDASSTNLTVGPPSPYGGRPSLSASQTSLPSYGRVFHRGRLITCIYIVGVGAFDDP